MQVVPPALLEFSRSILRTTFSSIMQKRVYTLECDRATVVTPNIRGKLQNAMRSSGVVISTPTTIKSFMLKLIESLDIIRDLDRPARTMKIEQDAAELSRILTLFKDGILIMDEVDLILHPLKSELNFPIGPKLELDPKPHNSHLRWGLPIHLLDAVFYAERESMSVPFGESKRANEILARLCVVIENGYSENALQKSPHLVLLNPDWYHDKMRTLMAEWVSLWMDAQHLTGITTEDAIAFMEHGPPKLTLTQLSSEQEALVQLEAKISETAEGDEKNILVLRADRRRKQLMDEKRGEVVLRALSERVTAGVDPLHMQLLHLDLWVKVIS